MGERPTKFRGTFQSYVLSKPGKVWHVGRNGWRSRTETTKGRTTTRMMREIYYLVSMRCWRIRPFQEGKNGKGNEDEVHHVPAPSLSFRLERKPISCPGTPLDDTATPTAFHVNQSDEADRVYCTCKEIKAGSRERKSSKRAPARR